MGLSPVSYSLGRIEDAEKLFSLLAHRPWSVWLDSGESHSDDAKHDVFACEPAVTLVTRGKLTEVAGDTCYRVSPRDPMELLRFELNRRSSDSNGSEKAWLPGAAIGYFAYDLGRRFESSLGDKSSGVLPDMSVGLYDWLIVRERKTGEAQIIGANDSSSVLRQIAYWRNRFNTELSESSFQSSIHVEQEPLPDLTFDEYAQGFERVRHYLTEGDCYQVNLTQRFQATVSGDPWALYRRLRNINPAPFSAYLNYPWAQVLSASPERFLSVKSGVVETKPIKGTRPRSQDPQEDQRLAKELEQSSKDRAENVMIVDLLRNDLGRSCRYGTVSVPKLFEVESFATVHHLVSTVSGELREGLDALDLLRGCFPGGSITGAPKVRAMQVIDELESEAREIYCGSIGYIGYNGDMDTSIVIRTLLHQQGQVTYWAGGGLVIDSTLEEEYQETLDKGFAMQRVLQKQIND